MTDPSGHAGAPRIPVHALTSLATAMFQACGVPQEDASLVADSLAQADLWGHQSHGILRLRWYVDRIRHGVMEAITEPISIVDGGAIAVIDGGHGIGQVVAAHAMREAIDRARQHGVGAVGVRDSNHFGTAAYFTRMAPPAGCIGLLATNSSPAMAPWGGRVKTVGSNPWSLAAPVRDSTPMIMDISNTAVARGKIYLARNRGQVMPTGWAVTSDGRPTTDPVEAIAGMVLPMAAHKGYAISVMMDVLSGVLTGSGFGSAVNGPYQANLRSNCGHFCLALQIDAFLALEEFQDRMAALVEEVKSVPLADGFDEVHYPGELEEQAAQHNLHAGVLLPDETLSDLVRLAEELDVDVPPGLRR